MRNHVEFVRVSPGTGNGERRSDLLCVNLRGSFAAQYAQGIEHQCSHFVFARIDEDRGEERTVFADYVVHRFVVRHAARKQDGIHLTFENRSHRADLLGDAVTHRVEHGFGFLVALFDVDADLLHGVLVQVSYQTAFAGEHLQHVALAVLARKAEVHERSGRHRACTFGCDRAVAVEGVVGVDHPSLAVGRDRNAAAHVGNDQVQVFVTLAYLFGMAACDGFLVQGVEDRNAGAFRNTAQAGDVVQLIDHDRVGDVSLHAGSLGDLLGDQAAEMTPDGFTFYGGVSHGVEKRSKVRSRIVADQLVKLIKEADHVVIMGHRMSDLDAIGAAEGVLRICKICDVPAVIAVRRDATLAGSLINALVAAGQEDDFIDPKGALPIISQRTLCIIVDTYQLGLVESREILEKCGKVAVIDHHRKGVGFIENADLVCHEPYASSASELVTEFLQYVGDRDDKPNRIEAEGLLSGIMLDTRDFTLHTGVRTFEAAAALRRYGAETERVRQLFDVSMVEYTTKAMLVSEAQMYRGCAITVSGEVAPEARVAIAQAANDLLTIQNVEASFVAVQVGGGVNISARSLGAVNVQVIMEALGGGGHQTMAAAQLKHITPEAARSRIQTAIDQYREAQKKSGPESEPEQKKKDKQ